MMTVEGLKPGTTYVFRVRAKTDGGYGSYGGEIELETSHDGTDICTYLLCGHEKMVASPVIEPSFSWNLAGKGCKTVSEALERQRSFYSFPVKLSLIIIWITFLSPISFLPPLICAQHTTVFDSA